MWYIFHGSGKNLEFNLGKYSLVRQLSILWFGCHKANWRMWEVKAMWPRLHRHYVCMAENKRFGKILNVLSYHIDVPYPGSSEKTFHQNISSGHHTETSVLLNHKFPACVNVLCSQSTEFWGLCSVGGDIQESDTAFDIECSQSTCRIIVE